MDVHAIAVEVAVVASAVVVAVIGRCAATSCRKLRLLFRELVHDSFTANSQSPPPLSPMVRMVRRKLLQEVMEKNKKIQQDKKIAYDIKVAEVRIALVRCLLGHVFHHDPWVHCRTCGGCEI